MTRDEFLTALDALIAENHLLKHPFYQLWSQGKLTRENLREYAISYYPHVAAFPTYVSGVHSGANPISGEFSVGATGLRIADGSLGEPLREMTIASTLPEMLAGVSGVGSDLRFFSSVGTPSILIGEMTLAGV